MRRVLLALCAAGLLLGAAPPKKMPAPKRPARKTTARAPAKKPAAAEPAGPLPELAEIGMQNPAALIPFFERLYRSSERREPGGVHVLHFGDSHIAIDDWPHAIRTRLQERFGAGGPGFVQAGKPFAGFRRYDARGSSSDGWKPQGLLQREGDGLYGLAGVAMETESAGETLQLETEGGRVELWYWKQPGNGAFDLHDGETLLGRAESDGEAGPAYAGFALPAGPHHIMKLTTLDSRPVRVFGWALDRESGVTWETLGINGAQADLALSRSERLLKEHVERRDPALIVLAFGTNDARMPGWTLESYRAAFRQLVGRLRAAAPAASILIIGPPDQAMRARGTRRWSAVRGLDTVMAAQREVARESGCAFWNLRAAMGGKGSMPSWVRAGLAQPDYVHFTLPGYRLLGETLYELLMSQYDIFLSVRKQLEQAPGALPAQPLR